MFNRTLGSLILAFISGFSASHAATLANFNFAGGSLANSASPITGITISMLESDSAFLAFTSNTGWNSAAQISGAAGFFSVPTTHAAAGNAIRFSITASSGYRFSLDEFGFLARSTTTAPRDIGFKIGSHFHDFSASYSNDSTITSISESSLRYTDLTSITISIQGWNSSGAGALQLDDIILSGSVIPEPSITFLGMSGALVLLRRRR
jgi:hypothetical protein